jgi:hypothetical protein
MARQSTLPREPIVRNRRYIASNFLAGQRFPPTHTDRNGGDERGTMDRTIPDVVVTVSRRWKLLQESSEYLRYRSMAEACRVFHSVVIKKSA